MGYGEWASLVLITYNFNLIFIIYLAFPTFGYISDNMENTQIYII